ncbi:alpha-galactosidase, partial [Ancrocorticia populi]|uniref:alpha-galactosidase n=1 Tax=Ancrocorticia populi TaxID=2175228 RepID=UPI003F951B62
MSELATVEAIHLRAGEVSLVLQVVEGAVPRIAFWGPELPDLTPDTLLTLCDAQWPPLQDADGIDGSMCPGIIPLASDGWMGRPGLVGRRAMGKGWAPRLRTSSVTTDSGHFVTTEGKRYEGQTKQVSRVVLGGTGVITFHLLDEEVGLFVDLDVEMLPSGMMRMKATLINTDDVADYELDELALMVPIPLEADEILDFAGRWGRERDPQRSPVRAGCHLREGRRGRTGFDAPGTMFCGEQGFSFAHGRLWALHVAHSGNVRSWVERMATGVQVIGGGELLMPGEISLKPGESYASPWIYVQTANGLDAAARCLHSWERSLASHPSAMRPVALNVWEAVYFTHDLDTLKSLADKAAQIGIERYIVDDGWFLGRRDERRALGDWTVDPDVWPEGLHPLIKHVRSLGMQFGLWFEPEMISGDSNLAREHPEWIMRARNDAPPIEKRFQQVLNLAIPEAWEHVRTQIDAIISEYQIDYIKWDHNRDLIDAGDTRYGGQAGIHKQTAASYRLIDRLREDHPGLEIESCSSGGSRIDLEMVQHVQRFWLSDCIDPVERQSIQRWSSQVLAPELMGTHVASERSHTTGRVADLSYRLGTAIWGHMGFETNLLDVDDEELKIMSQWVSFYKENREFLLTGDIVRRSIADGSLWLHGVVASDQSRARYGMSCVSRSPMAPRGLIMLPGLRAGTRSRVRPVLSGDGPRGR